VAVEDLKSAGQQSHRRMKESMAWWPTEIDG